MAVTQTDMILSEYLISTLRVGRINLPFSGGFYARFLPYRLIRQGIQAINAAGYPAIFYLHPWELDPDHPRIVEGVPALYRFTHYFNLSSMQSKLEALLRDFRFGPLSSTAPK